MNEPVKTLIKDSILEVTIDRPKANAIDAKTSIILGEIFSNFRDDPNLKVKEETYMSTPRFEPTTFGLEVGNAWQTPKTSSFCLFNQCNFLKH